MSGIGLEVASARYMEAVERDIAQAQAYENAIATYDNMIKSQTAILDATKVDSKTFAVSNPDAGKYVPVVFMNIDETILDNAAYDIWAILNNTHYTSQSWTAWCQEGVAKEIPGAIKFIKHVWENGGVVMFNSNRIQSKDTKYDQRAGTIKNLKALGLDDKMMKDFVWLMDGCDAEKHPEAPWTTTDNLYLHIAKDVRMDTISFSNQDKGFDLSAYGSGNSVKFRTIMRIGDDFNGFWETTSKSKGSEAKKTIHNEHKDFFTAQGSTSIKLDKDAKVVSEKAARNWKEAFIQIPENIWYGGWEQALANGKYFKNSYLRIKTSLEIIEKYSWHHKI